MVGEHYPLELTLENEQFYFKSIGTLGVFSKLIHFESDGTGIRFNLALCVWHNDDWVDDVETNNDDFLKTMYTVAHAVSAFFESHPNAILEIKASEKRRLRVYNGIFKRRLVEIKKLYNLMGIGKDEKEPYNPENEYLGFEITLKKP